MEGNEPANPRTVIMELSFSTNAFVRFSVFEAIGMIAEAGFKGVEILADIPHLYPPSTTDSDLKSMVSALREKDIRCANINANTAVGYYGRSFWEPLFEPSLANPDPEARRWRIEYTKKCIDMACMLSCGNVSITSGRMVPGVRPEQSLALLEESLDEVLRYAAGKNVRIGMEYEPGLLVERFGELKDLIESVGCENFGANLDLGHSHVLGENPREVIESFSSRIFHIHIEDIRSGKHYHLPPGEGDLNFSLIFQALRDVLYSGFVTVELYTFPGDPGQVAKAAFDYLDDLT